MKNLLLLGGGHAHLHVLKSLAEKPLPGVAVTLMSAHSRQVYSGMVPGWVSGHYAIEDCVVPLAPLCRAAGVTFIETAVTRIDFSARVAHGSHQAAAPFDVLSIDTGPVANVSVIPGAAHHATSVRPLESFIDAYPRIAAEVAARSSAGKDSRIVFVGGGAAGVELALSMQHALRDMRTTFTLVSAENTLPGNVGPRLHRLMRERGFRVLTDTRAKKIGEGEVTLENGEEIAADFVIVSLGASAATWPAESGLRTDEDGFILINDHLQSTSHHTVFAAGDAATMVNFTRPKSGVYAVRVGPPLMENLRRYFESEALVKHAPQKRSLYLVSTGDRYAVGSWGGLSWEGGWVWGWKDWIDKGFVGKYLVK